MNSKFDFQQIDIEGAVLLTPLYLEDERGYFQKNYEFEIFESHGLNGRMAEEFETMSKHNVIRGLHFQTQFPQDKIVRCVSGEVFDVIVDLRQNSKTFKEWRGFNLSEENHRSLYIPRGCAHGFLVLSERALVSYLCVGKYYAEYDSGIRWDDPSLNISWPTDVSSTLTVSSRDKALPLLEEYLMKYGGF